MAYLLDLRGDLFWKALFFDSKRVSEPDIARRSSSATAYNGQTAAG
jgi:hypothetical protein